MDYWYVLVQTLSMRIFGHFKKKALGLAKGFLSGGKY